MINSFQDKTAIVTGGATGIGQAVCEYFGENGANVVINYFSDDQKANKGIGNGESKRNKIKWSDVVRGKSSTDGKISTNRTYDSKGVEYVRI